MSEPSPPYFCRGRGGWAVGCCAKALRGERATGLGQLLRGAFAALERGRLCTEPRAAAGLGDLGRLVRVDDCELAALAHDLVGGRDGLLGERVARVEVARGLADFLVEADVAGEGGRGVGLVDDERGDFARALLVVCEADEVVELVAFGDADLVFGFVLGGAGGEAA